jgi:hypothetical protein
MIFKTSKINIDKLMEDAIMEAISYNKQLQIDSLKSAISRKKKAIKDTKQLCNAPVTTKWIAEQRRQLKIMRNRLYIVKKHKAPVHFTNDLKCEFILLEAR